MVVMYEIAGRKVGSHVLAMATLGTLFAGSFLALGGSKKSQEKGPAITASNKDEEDFIRDFVAKAEAQEVTPKTAKH